MSGPSKVVKLTTLTGLDKLAARLSERDRDIETGLRVRWNASRQEQGLLLREYQKLYKPSRQWTGFLRAVGIAEKTAYRIMGDAARVEQIPGTVITAAKLRGIDLAERKYAPTVTMIEAELVEDDPVEVDEDRAEKIMAKVLPFIRRQRTSVLFEQLSIEEKSEWDIRMKIRAAMNNIADDKKLAALISALEQEMYSVWGSTSPISVTITPRPSILDTYGRRLEAAESE